MYRKDLFEKYGLEVPKTWDEAYETAKKLMIDEDNDGETDIYGFQFRWLRGIGHNTSQWAHMFMSYGGTWFDDKWNPLLDTKEAIETTKMFVKVGTDAGPPAMQGYGWTECLANIAEGKVAMWHDNSVGMSTLEDKEISKVVGKMGYAPALAGPAGANTGTWPWGIGMNAFSKKKEATWLFLLWITSKETALAKLMEVGSPRESVVNSDAYKSMYPADWVESFNIGMKSSVTLMAPILPETIPLVDVLAIKLSEATQGIKSSEQAMKETNEEWRTILEEADYYK
jgi:ABC-type glycerol-3-phosphate transport system substrate-binding protein